MSTVYPADLDTFTNPTATDPQNAPSHSGQHADKNDAIEALEAKVGVDGSAVATSIDKRVADLEAAGGGHPDLAAHDALGLATDAELATHEGAADPHPTYETSAEAQAKVDVHTADAVDAHDASAVSVVPTGAVVATDVQAAIAELDSEKSALAHTHTHAAATGQTPTDHHDNSDDHAEAHTVASHSDTGATGAELEELTDGSTTVLHAHTAAGHPDLATHDALGLATDAELATHAGAADPHPGYLTPAEGDAAYEPSGAVATHAGAADPHPTYETSAEAAAKVTTHAGEADPHTGYQKESEKGAASGYASLDAGGTVPDAQIPAAIARDSELHAEAHAAAHAPAGGDSLDGTYATDAALAAHLATENADHGLEHADLNAVGADDHHPQDHTHAVTMVVFTGTGPSTFDKADYPDATHIRVRVVGGGGGGGGAQATGAGEGAAAGGGGGGGYAEVVLPMSALSASTTWTNGAGGQGGAAGNNNGAAGGTASFGAHVSASGGAGGDSGPASSAYLIQPGGLGGAGSDGDINLNGSDGNNGIRQANDIYQQGFGGGAPGIGGGITRASSVTAGSAGLNAGTVSYGSGGSGAHNRASQTAKAGGDGAPGLVIVEVFRGAA